MEGKGLMSKRRAVRVSTLNRRFQRIENELNRLQVNDRKRKELEIALADLKAFIHRNTIWNKQKYL